MKRNHFGLLAWLLIVAAMLLGCQKSGKGDVWGEINGEVSSSSKIEKSQSLSSTAMGRAMKYSVWLPPTYDEKKTYPVLYLLHGYEMDPTDAHNKWLSTETYYGYPNGGNLDYIATQYVKGGGVPFVVVTPNCPNDFYRDIQGGDKYETFFIEEFIPAIEKKYHGNGKRAIAGLSMGGYGTLYHGFRHPDMFTAMYAMSPATSAFGEPYPSLVSLVSTADVSKLPKLTIETGTDDTTVSLSSVQSFVNKLKTNNIPHDFITRPGGHDWQFWQECLPKALKLAGDTFK
jgi:enterochelin esterase-like enzyme